MKITGLLFFCVFFLCISLTVNAETPNPSARDATGLEWLQMSGTDRVGAIQVSLYVLDRHGVEFSKKPIEYYDEINRRLLSNPGLYPVAITNILASIIYDTEPASRTALDKTRGKSG